MIAKTLITARGGSKGIPRKNIIDIKGKPLIQYTIKASIRSNVSETWVSTDDLEIANISKGCGAKVIIRPNELCDDIIMPDAALTHFAQNEDFDVLVFIQPTSPLLESKYINIGLAMMKDNDSVFTAYKQHWYPQWRSNAEPLGWNIQKRPRRQDVEEVFVENGALYITTREQLLKSGLRYGGKIGIIEMPLHESFQLDSKDDLKLLEKLL